MALAALALVYALAPAAHASSVTPKIVNGQDVTDIAQRPYQVAVLPPGELCGGVILDERHVVTAAHCVSDGSGQLLPPTGYQIVAGTNNLSDPAATVVGAKTLSRDDQYNPDTLDHDVAVIELSSPLWTATTPPTIDGSAPIAPIQLIDKATFDSDLSAGATATVSGWGYDEPVACDPTASPPSCDSPSDPNGFPTTLKTVDIPLISDTDCLAAFATGQPFETEITDTMFCAGVDNAGAANKDSCNGDSGGPLVVPTGPTTPNDFKLAGLVDSGFGCAQDNLPGIYTRVSEPTVTAFINARDDPKLTDAPTISGGSQVGQTVTCTPGTWTSAGTPTFMYRLYRDSGAGPAPITSQSTNPTFTLPAAAGSHNVFCDVQAALPDTHTFRTADSNEIAVAAAPTPPPVIPPPPPPPPPARDSIAPTLRISHKACTKTKCTVKVRVRDASPSSGIAKVKATLSFRHKTRCRVKHSHKTRPCTKRVHRTLHAKAGSGGVYTIVAKHLKPNTSYTITLVPFDKAGNRPQFSTVTNVRTQPKHRRLF